MTTETVINIAARTVPYDDAHASNGFMFDVLSLIHAAAELNENGCTVTDPGGLTDEKSRITSLLIQALEKTSAAIHALKL